MKAVFFMIFVLIFSVIFGAEKASDYDFLTFFLMQVIESGSIDATVNMEFHLMDSDSNDSYRDMTVRMRFILSDWEDLYLEFFEPEELADVSFVYLAREEVVFSMVNGIPWKQYRWSYEADLIGNLLGQFLRGLMEPANFSWEVENEPQRSVFRIVPSDTKLRFLGLLSGGGYIPNLMRIYISLFTREGYSPTLDYVKITDRLEEEYLYIEFETFSLSVDRRIFSDSRKKFYESFQK